MRAEREQRALEVLGQRPVRADQAQPEADLGVELVVHPLSVLALADELLDYGHRAATSSSLVFARHRVAAERRGVAHRRDRRLAVDLDHRARRAPPRSGLAPPSASASHVPRAARRVREQGVRRRGARSGSQGRIVAVSAGRRLRQRGLGREHAGHAAQRRLERDQPETLVHRRVDDRAGVSDQPGLLLLARPGPAPRRPRAARGAASRNARSSSQRGSVRDVRPGEHEAALPAVVARAARRAGAAQRPCSCGGSRCRGRAGSRPRAGPRTDRRAPPVGAAALEVRWSRPGGTTLMRASSTSASESSSRRVCSEKTTTRSAAERPCRLARR